MSEEEVFERFKRAVRFKRYGFISFILSTIPAVFLEGALRFALFILIFGMGIYFDMQFKCPACEKRFDSRIRNDDLKYCNSCSSRLQR
ncbi:hypothetical protein SAMN02745945_00625 [Peptoclostridium litorale DSM 5388]|uniref:Uncharacterized protein n=1 Tax=Peptoclostridium litorale DSM 5388 TaxID=1121324 RepID=A0A069RD75_PEPLI|nr:hypothetical protein [Peptoclostridium litorale]KDR95009.1 hypothetical protein CLIT_11c00360 [Peptoclostridium litorale DSM 5388]SIN76608.1 hypothetical protein SAMN02745945_00625 [Peptoclostridium litorale DSM 5388]